MKWGCSQGDEQEGVGWFVVGSVPGRRDGMPSGMRARRWYHNRGSRGSVGRYVLVSPSSPLHSRSGVERK